MVPHDLVGLVAFTLELIGRIWHNWGANWSLGATIPYYMDKATVGVFGENGGLIYWINSKLLWLMEQILSGISFTSPL